MRYYRYHSRPLTLKNLIKYCWKRRKDIQMKQKLNVTNKSEIQFQHQQYVPSPIMSVPGEEYNKNYRDLLIWHICTILLLVKTFYLCKITQNTLIIIANGKHFTLWFTFVVASMSSFSGFPRHSLVSLGGKVGIKFNINDFYCIWNSKNNDFKSNG